MRKLKNILPSSLYPRTTSEAKPMYITPITSYLAPLHSAHHPPLFATENDLGDLCLTSSYITTATSSYITTAKQSPPNPDLDTDTGL